MIQYLIISDVPSVASALQKVISTFFQTNVLPDDTPKVIHKLTLKREYELLERVNVYSELVAWIETNILASEGGVPQPVIACASVEIDSMADLDPLTHRGAASILGMLILTFPEIEWVIGNGMQMPICEPVSIPTVPEKGQSETGRPVSLSTLTLTQAVDLVRAGHSPIFDGRGLRDALYTAIRAKNPAEAWYLPRRESFAAAIDDERSYAFFNAYVAYRFGFRGYAVTTLNLMQLLLNEESPSKAPDIVVEDLHLNFKDREAKYHLSNLEKRDKDFKSLANVRLRVIASSGGSTKKEEKDLANAKEHLKGKGFIHLDSASETLTQQPASGDDRKWWSKIMKPFSGVFDLYKDGGIEFFVESTDRRKPFVWPPKYTNQEAVKSDDIGHSCAGVLLIIAEQLIRRARLLQKDVDCVEMSVYGAVLSGMACELLGCKTPTSALEALALKHYFEALAECQFYGVQSSVDVRGRLADLKNEVKVIGECFVESNRAVAVLNGKAAIVDVLVQMYREQNQFDEEQTCLCEARKLHRGIHCEEMIVGLHCQEGDWVQKVKCAVWGVLSFPKAVTVNCSLWYLHLCLRSLFTFLLILVGWGLFWSIACLLARHHDLSVLSSLSFSRVWGAVGEYGPKALAEGIGLLFGANILNDLENSWFELINVFGVIMSFVHVGIFVSYVYSIVSRR